MGRLRRGTYSIHDMDRQDYPRTYSIRPEVKRDYSAISLIPIWLALAVTALYCLKLVSPNVTILTIYEIDEFLALTGGLFYWMIFFHGGGEGCAS